MEGRRRLGDLLAGSAGALLAHGLNHLPLARYYLQRLGETASFFRLGGEALTEINLFRVLDLGPSAPGVLDWCRASPPIRTRVLRLLFGRYETIASRSLSSEPLGLQSTAAPLAAGGNDASPPDVNEIESVRLDCKMLSVRVTT